MTRPKRPPAPAPEPPAGLSVESRAAWPGYCLDLHEVHGGLAAVDAALLGDLLRASDRLTEVRKLLGAEGLTIAGSKGQTRPHPLLVTESSLSREVATGFERLGLAPRSRGRVFMDVQDGRLVRGYP